MENTHLPQDFKDFLKLLNENDVHYLLIGGYAVGYFPVKIIHLDDLLTNKVASGRHKDLDDVSNLPKKWPEA